jgi:hypothetical protein
MKKYSYDSWNHILDMPDGPEKDRQIRMVGKLVKGNLHWFARRLFGLPSDPAYCFSRDQMIVQSDFLRIARTYEDTLGIY